MTPPDPSARPNLAQVLDRALRGQYLDASAAGSAQGAGTTDFLRLAVLLGAAYGMFVGTYALFHGGDRAGLQLLSAALKVPALFALTVLVTFPSLYVFAALQRLPLQPGATLRLLLLSIVVHCAVLASLGPVFAFFSASTDSYAFLKLLNVLFFAIGGVLGLMVMRRATRTLLGQAELSEAGPALRLWAIVYCLVGAQMGWLLRPFLGDPQLPFAVLRPRDGNVLTGLVDTLRQLFGG
ncbi:MAG: hypothetical protein R3F29_10120 [Planctomycetota bacterium]